MNLKANHNLAEIKLARNVLLRYLKGNESESKSQLCLFVSSSEERCCVTSKVMNLKANHNLHRQRVLLDHVVALPQR